MRGKSLTVLALFCLGQSYGLKVEIPTSGFSEETFKALIKSSRRIEHISKHVSSIAKPSFGKRHSDETIMELLSTSQMENLSRIIEKDKQNLGLFKDFYKITTVAISQNDSIDPALVLQMAEMVPLLSTSNICFDQSMAFLEALISKMTWPLLMLDYSAKIPDGIYTNTIKPNNTQQELPFGNHFVPGSYDACLNLDVPIGRKKSVKGRWYMLKLHASPKIFSDNNIDMPPLPHERFLKEGHNYNTLIQQAFSKPDLETTFDTKLTGLKEILQIAQTINFWGYKWGVCVPSSCDYDAVINNTQTLLDKYLNPIQFPEGKINLHAKIALPSQTKEDNKPTFEAGNIAYICGLSILGSFIVFGTVVDIINKYNSKKDLSLIEKVLKCFSLHENGTKVLSTKVGGPDHITCLGGIRQISMMWVVLGHTFMYFQFVGPQFATNRQRIFSLFTDKETISPAIELVQNATPSVDTFFFLSGLLVGYFTFLQLEKRRFNIVVYFVHRYIRLTIPYAFALLAVIYINPYIPKGPYGFAYDSGERSTPQQCRKNWYLNLLYVSQTIYRNDGCMGVTWYLSDDMQMYWYAPLVMIPIWWDEKLGLVWWCINFLGWTAWQGYLTGKYHFGPASSIGNDKAHGLINDGLLTQGDYYFKVYTRMQPYVIGLLMGYVFFKTRGKQIKIPHGFLVSSLLWLLSVGVGLVIILGVHPMWLHGFSNFESTVYAMFFRIGWSLALSWTTFACAKGYGGPINSLLSWGPFTVLGRLTFFSYLIHLEIIPIILDSISWSFEINNFQVVMFYIGTLVIVQATAFVMTLCFEMPFGGLEKIVMSKIMGGGKKRVPNSASSKDKSEENQAAKISSPHEAQSNHLGEAHGPAPESFSDKESEALASAQNVIENHVAKNGTPTFPPPSFNDIMVTDNSSKLK